MSKFIPGLELSERFFFEAVKPILDKELPNLKYSAGLIGYGSEVLGFDTEESTDHHWGPRFLMFLEEENFDAQKVEIDKILSEKLPHNFLGFSTNYTEGDKIGVRHPEPITSGPIRHFVEFYTIKSYLEKRLNISSVESLTNVDWIKFPEQRLLETISGKVFIDGLGKLEEMREALHYYPKDVWLYRLASEWQKISDIEAFVGRCGDVDDDLGSRLVASDIIKSIMNLCFLMERSYIPYSKWFGSGFKRLKSSEVLLPVLMNIMTSPDWKERESNLSQAYKIIAHMHNNLNITEKMSEEVESYYGRPYLVIRADKFAEKIMDQIPEGSREEMK
ncbi:TPA: DUF4037 domain-containing protein [Candidatus Berkelbacteria bacterium]|uniref:DUF4037 domain-containing protein n=1 Tax=Berkelbacteria bacterium GW2011_GWE1_39_12 TaxID=1618337 RepID=A0A0G4B341_9BACT|nr:MAG: hypothetical protein UT28_C0001G0562 [Berkelbacteria bacterium GW2011_GWE1_39_12]HBO60956.1 DUF4037 domain-containing protein [Candidatus Berkelbacteria bacterium]